MNKRRLVHSRWVERQVREQEEWEYLQEAQMGQLKDALLSRLAQQKEFWERWHQQDKALVDTCEHSYEKARARLRDEYEVSLTPRVDEVPVGLERSN